MCVYAYVYVYVYICIHLEPKFSELTVDPVRVPFVGMPLLLADALSIAQSSTAIAIVQMDHVGHHGEITR